MKVYCFYLLTNGLTEDSRVLDLCADGDHATKLDGYGSAFLFGYTHKKKLAKFFEKTRNMKRLVKVVYDMDKKSYEDFTSKSIYQQIYLYDIETRIFDRVEDTNSEVQIIQFPATVAENEFCSDKYEYIDDAFIDVSSGIQTMFLIIAALKNSAKSKIDDDVYLDIIDKMIAISSGDEIVHINLDYMMVLMTEFPELYATE